MSEKIDYKEVMIRMKMDLNYIAEEAYKRGYDKGYADKTNNDKVCKDLAENFYQRGLNEAWQAGRKVVLSPDEGGMSVQDLFAIFGNNSIENVFRKYSASEAIEKMKAYEEIKVGDFSALIDYLSQFDESDVAKVKYIRQKIEAAIGENIDWYERRKS